jgi:PTS system nitrogen regulatory IIA component
MVRFKEIIGHSTVCLNLDETDGPQVVARLIQAAVDEGRLPAERRDEVVQTVLKRERGASTAMPDGIALPHGRTDCVRDILCVIGIHPRGIEFGAPDLEPTHIFVLLLVPLTVGCNHISFLANLSRRLMEQSVRDNLVRALSREAVLRALLEEGTES